MKFTQNEWKQLLNRIQTNDPALNSLDLSWKEIGDRKARTLAKALKSNQTIRTLELCGNKIGVAGAQALAETLKVNQTVTNINLMDNQIGAAGTQALAETLKVNQILRAIDLRDNKIGTAGAQALAEALKVNQSIRYMGLYRNQISAAGVQALAEALKVNQTLITIDLSNNSIDDAGAQALGEALKVNQTVTTINLHYNNIGDAGAQALGEALKVNQTVTNIESYSIKIDAGKKDDLLSDLARNRRLSDELHNAVKKGQLDNTQKLINQKVSLHSFSGEDNNTPLHWAVLNNLPNMTQFLIQEMHARNILLEICNKKGETALGIAKKMNNPVLIKLLSDTSHLPLPQPSPTPVAKIIPLQEAIALYDYTARNANELSFKANETLFILDQDQSGWWKAKQGSKQGLAPSNYIQLKSAMSANKLPPLPPSPQVKTVPAALETKASSSNLPLNFTIDYSQLKIGEKLGEGGFGIVKKGTYRFNNVAIKELHLENLSEASLAEFKSEMQLMMSLHSPQIIQLYGVYFKPSYGIVMEYMPMGSLYDVLKSDKPLGWDIRYNIAKDIALGLAFLHAEPIYHRDLKSLNVLLDEHYRAKLTDFGLAKIKNESASTSTTAKQVGTLRWMAPEIMEEEKYTDKADIYSCAVTFWELATREIPFKDKSDLFVMRQVTAGKRLEQQPIPVDCPEKIAMLIRQCWMMDLAKRPSASEMVTVLTAKEAPVQSTITISGSYRGNLDSFNRELG